MFCVLARLVLAFQLKLGHNQADVGDRKRAISPFDEEHTIQCVRKGTLTGVSRRGDHFKLHADLCLLSVRIGEGVTAGYDQRQRHEKSEHESHSYLLRFDFSITQPRC